MRRFTGVQKFRRLFYTRSKIRTLLQETRRAEESFLKNKNSSPPDLLLALKKSSWSSYVFAICYNCARKRSPETFRS